MGNVAALQEAAENAGRGIAESRAKGSGSRSADPWDIHVGQRLREGRVMRSLSQQAVAEAAGISFQQVQKYERGTNRISPGRLVRFAEALDVKPGWFFEGRDGIIGDKAAETDVLAGLSASDLTVARDVARLSPELRQRVVGLIRALVDETSETRAASD